MTSPGRLLRLGASVLAAAAVGWGLPASGQEADTDQGRAFRVSKPPARYAVAEQTRQLRVTGADGARLFVEVWVPAAKGRAVPPKRVPVVAVVTPYAMKGLPRPDRLNAVPRWTELFVSRGYAMANVHLRGTGESGGCWGSHDRVDADDASRALAALAAAPFSDGRIGLFGKSHDGAAALNVAGRGARDRLRGLRAVIAVSPVTSYGDFTLSDGVPLPVDQANIVAIDADTSYTSRSAGTGGTVIGDYVSNGNKDPDKAAARTPCRAEQAAAVLGSDGRMNPWLLERELALHTAAIRVPTLMTMGLGEIQTRQLTGAFDRLRRPKLGVFSTSNHDYPDQNRNTPSQSREDWEAVVLAWLDRWVRGTRNGVDAWPVAQVQDSEGQWRAEPGFPRTGGPAGQLALGPGGTLGTARPTGSTSYLEASGGADGQGATTFTTAPLTAPLEIVGQVFGDLWVTLDRPAAHLNAELTAYDDSGAVLGVRLAARSARFLGPLRGDRFVQTEPATPAVGLPLRVTLRFEPTDLVVPAGGRVELTLRGVRPDGASPSGGGTTVTVLHDCTHPSRLRFLLPRAQRDLLDVLDGDEPAALGTNGAGLRGLRDGGGLASAPVCGRADARDVALQGRPVG